MSAPAVTSPAKISPAVRRASDTTHRGYVYLAGGGRLDLTGLDNGGTARITPLAGATVEAAITVTDAAKGEFSFTYAGVVSACRFDLKLDWGDIITYAPSSGYAYILPVVS